MVKKQSFNLKALFLWLAIGGLIGWQLTLATLPQATGTSSASTFNSDNVDLDLLFDVWNAIEDEYIDLDEIVEQEQIYGAVSGLVESLNDPYSVFMDPEETELFHSSLNSELQGIGAELTVKDGRLTIVSPLKDTPAEKAGVLPGDYIFAVDGEPTSDMTMWDAIMLIRGEPGTDVTLTIIRDGLEETLDITITRAEIQVPSIELTFDESTGKKLAHIALYQFAEDTYNEFKNALREITLEEADGVVVDMRLNGGGFLDVSIEMLGEFFNDEVGGVIVKRRNEENEIMYTAGGGSMPDMPLVVLIDEGSASASEIVAGALQDYDRATLIGEQSFGKGSVQELSNLQGGSSLRLTIAKWYTPDDRSINKVGITPDIIIEMESDLIDTEEDIQLQAAYNLLSE